MINISFGSILTLFLALGAIFAFFFLLVYLYVAFCIMKIADKLKMKNSWLAFIPIANFFLLTQMAGVSPWWTLGLAAFMIPFIGGILVAVLFVWLWWSVMKKLNQSEWFSLLLLIPLVNLIVLTVLAFS